MCVGLKKKIRYGFDPVSTLGCDSQVELTELQVGEHDLELLTSPTATSRVGEAGRELGRAVTKPDLGGAEVAGAKSNGAEGGAADAGARIRHTAEYGTVE